MKNPLAIDLCCGLGGWTDGLIAEGYSVIGFDVENHVYGEHRYPGQLVLQDVLTVHGSQFRDVDLIVASPPCQEFSYMAMPWSLAKKKAEEYRTGVRDRSQLTAIFDACFRIQREAIEAAGRFIPLIVENVKGAQPWVGRARWNYGSYYLWGDVPALMPMTASATKVPGFRFDGSGGSFQTASVQAHIKNPGQNWVRDYAAGKVSPHWNVSALKNAGGNWSRPHNPIVTPHMTNPSEHGIKQHGSGAEWFDKGIASLPSGSPRRKAASALIAKIPIDLARHIARVYYSKAAA